MDKLLIYTFYVFFFNIFCQNHDSKSSNVNYPSQQENIVSESVTLRQNRPRNIYNRKNTYQDRYVSADQNVKINVRKQRKKPTNPTTQQYSTVTSAPVTLTTARPPDYTNIQGSNNVLREGGVVTEKPVNSPNNQINVEVNQMVDVKQLGQTMTCLNCGMEDSKKIKINLRKLRRARNPCICRRNIINKNTTKVSTLMETAQIIFAKLILTDPTKQTGSLDAKEDYVLMDFMPNCDYLPGGQYECNYEVNSPNSVSDFLNNLD
ncbi:hypothetical protein HZS_2615 [Henneguya salminicola]|nr:hypothetical protein HZS_2615 [Henneguya salminicola]